VEEDETVRTGRQRAGRAAALALGLALAATACGDDGDTTTDGPSVSAVSGTISGDGSSTVFPIMEAVAEEITKTHPGIDIQVGSSGTGGGFEKFCNGETDFSNASRKIKDEEAATCTAKGVQYTELQVAIDGLSVVTNKSLAIDCLTVDELKKLWVSGSSVKKYSDLRAGLPASEVKLFGPGSDSGTYDFFLEEVLGKDSKFRTDPAVTTSENDNDLVQGIEASPTGLGYFGYAYYTANQDKLNLVGVDGGKGCVKPSDTSVRDGSYDPLSRPLFVYVKNSVLDTPAGEAFARYLVTDAKPLVSEVGYVQLTDAEYQSQLAKLG
jgi:phosphate transport system substrate-binding protein